ncbi:hypothetical protein EUZ85_26375 [Hahella sp. KA22]|uniref:hypothetical protein n=1 Tax=Hahella sp. KA22 TaxID=1628392 RepID=UPI000FDD7EDF|nr:hypothetical protein [Hahella sp. KA22]AZZ94054.1 hypothetical protein ENC22_23790 [Hahella sp. KA22]QAY57428.1 hypothetical protein EUZ85_26375 [Hahella sp. KA22]
MSKNLDLNAEIVAGESAAGFYIGMNLREIDHLLKEAETIEYYQGFNLVEKIHSTKGYFVLKHITGDKGSSVYYGNGLLHLEFNNSSELFCIYVYRGYLGSYKNIMVGDSLNELRAKEALQYDEGDDMYYRLDQEKYVPGLAIIALGDENNDDPIEGFCVHNWSMQNA